MNPDEIRKLEAAFGELLPVANKVLVLLNESPPGLDTEAIAHRLDLHPLEVTEVLSIAGTLGLVEMKP